MSMLCEKFTPDPLDTDSNRNGITKLTYMGTGIFPIAIRLTQKPVKFIKHNVFVVRVLIFRDQKELSFS